MKHILKLSIIASALLLGACAQDVIYELPDGDKYDNVYIVQAVQTPVPVRLSTRQENPGTKLNAFFSGLEAARDINLTFTVDTSLVSAYNAEHQTDYLLAPEGSYTLEDSTAVIKAGECKSAFVNLSFNIDGYLEPMVEYMIAVRMDTKDAKLNETKSVIYYSINVAKDMTPIVVGGHIEDCYEFFSFNDKCILTRDRYTTGELCRYGYDPETDSFGPKEVKQTGWAYGSVPYIAAGGNNTLQVVNGNWTWIVLNCNEDATEIPNYDQYTSVVTGGCGIFLDPVANPHLDGFLAIDGGSGWMHYYEMAEDWQNLKSGFVHTNSGNFNFWSYRLRFCREGDVYGIDAAGDMWRHPWDAASYTFKDREKVGSGWDKYTHVTPFGTDLVVRCEDGSLLRYEFDPRMFWDLNSL